MNNSSWFFHPTMDELLIETIKPGNKQPDFARQFLAIASRGVPFLNRIEYGDKFLTTPAAVQLDDYIIAGYPSKLNLNKVLNYMEDDLNGIVQMNKKEDIVPFYMKIDNTLRKACGLPETDKNVGYAANDGKFAMRFFSQRGHRENSLPNTFQLDVAAISAGAVTNFLKFSMQDAQVSENVFKNMQIGLGKKTILSYPFGPETFTGLTVVTNKLNEVFA